MQGCTQQDFSMLLPANAAHNSQIPTESVNHRGSHFKAVLSRCTLLGIQWQSLLKGASAGTSKGVEVAEASQQDVRSKTSANA
jgi:hypothetical protein